MEVESSFGKYLCPGTFNETLYMVSDPAKQTQPVLGLSLDKGSGFLPLAFSMSKEAIAEFASYCNRVPSGG